MMSCEGLFVWRKKMEKLGVEWSKKSEKKRRRERMAELEKVKRRREERQAQRVQQEDEMAQRERARAHHHDLDLEKKERQFDFHQSQMRAQIRLRQGRPKPIDILLSQECSAANNPPPSSYKIFKVFKGLTLEQREELHNDIKHQMDYYCYYYDPTTTTTTIRRRRYWEALLVVSEWELAAANAMKTKGDDDDGALLSHQGLHDSIEQDVNSLLAGKTCVELEALQSQIESQMQSGAAKLVEYWEALLIRLRLYKAKAFLNENYNTQESSESEESIHDDDDQGLEAAKEEQGPGALYDDDDKYRLLRRPKYLNRVHTGYVWNKYNRTHYDHDNPPPKKVQGYKFNIFYPDLAEQSRVPTYTVEEDATDADTCIIRFRAGPPYQDIAFRIVNAEWDYSPKKGFKSSFQNGVLRLYFNLKRFTYRR